MIATCVLAAEYAGTLDLHDTTTVQVRATQESSTPGLQAGFDFSTTPSATVRLTDRRSAYTLSYSPSLILPDLEQGFHLEPYQFASAVAAWHDRFTTFTVIEAASFGQLKSGLLYQAPPVAGGPQQTTVLQPAPANKTLELGSSSTDATLSQRVGRRLRVSLSGGYLVSGGIDAASQAYLPEQYGPRASASVIYQLSRRDSLNTRASAEEISTTGGCPSLAPTMSGICHERVDAARLDETLRRRLSRTTTLSLGGGLALYDIDAYGTVATIIYPVALATLAYRFGVRGTRTLSLSAELAPIVDDRTGLASERVQENVNLTDRIDRMLTLHFGVSGLETVPPLVGSDPYPVTIVTGSVDAILHLHRQVDLRIGAQALWQDQTGYGTLWSIFGYAALTVRAPPTR